MTGAVSTAAPGTGMPRFSRACAICAIWACMDSSHVLVGYPEGRNLLHGTVGGLGKPVDGFLLEGTAAHPHARDGLFVGGRKVLDGEDSEVAEGLVLGGGDRGPVAEWGTVERGLLVALPGLVGGAELTEPIGTESAFADLDFKPGEPLVRDAWDDVLGALRGQEGKGNVLRDVVAGFDGGVTVLDRAHLEGDIGGSCFSD
jgi:hypothetical protein